MKSNNIVRIAAAGAGKTFTICREAEKELSISKKSGISFKKVLLISYTTRAVDSIVSELRKANADVIPNGIEIMTWYCFLLNELIKPYQTEIFQINEVKGYYFNQHADGYNRYKKLDRRRYITNDCNINSEQAAELVITLNKIGNGIVFRRLEKNI